MVSADRLFEDYVNNNLDPIPAPSWPHRPAHAPSISGLSWDSVSVYDHDKIALAEYDMRRATHDGIDPSPYARYVASHYSVRANALRDWMSANPSVPRLVLDALAATVVEWEGKAADARSRITD